MKTRFLGGGMAALLLALALAGCNQGGSGGAGAPSGGAGAGASASSGSPSDELAKVGTSSVTRGQLQSYLEGAAGVQALPQLIDEQLIADALKEKKLDVSDAEVTAEANKLAQSDPSLKAELDAGGARAEFRRDQVRRTLMVQKLLTAGVPADDAKVKAFFDKYSSYYGTPAQVRLGVLASSTKARYDVLAKQLKGDPASFDKLVAEQKKALDPIGAQSTSDLGRALPLDQIATTLPPLASIAKSLATAKKGQVIPVSPLTPQGPFLIVKVVNIQAASKPDLAKVKDEATTDYKLSVAALAEIKKNPANPGTLDANIQQVRQFLGRQSPPGQQITMRSILNFILQGASQNLLTQLRGKGGVQISDPAYKTVADQYKPAPSPAGAPGAPGAAPGAAPATNGAAPAPAGAPGTSGAPAPATSNGAPAPGAPSAAAPAKP